VTRGRRKEFHENSLALWQVVEVKRNGGRHTLSNACKLAAKDLVRSREWNIGWDRLYRIHRAFEARMASDPEMEWFVRASLAAAREEHAKYPGTVLVPLRIRWLNKREYGHPGARRDSRLVHAFSVSKRQNDET
jgi:hypothetical protein